MIDRSIDQSSIHWFTPQMPVTARAGPDESQVPGTHLHVGSPVLEPSPDASQGAHQLQLGIRSRTRSQAQGFQGKQLC